MYLRPFTQHGVFCCCCTSLVNFQLHRPTSPSEGRSSGGTTGASCYSCGCSACGQPGTGSHAAAFAAVQKSFLCLSCPLLCIGLTPCGLLSVCQIVPFRIYIYWCSSAQNFPWEACWPLSFSWGPVWIRAKKSKRQDALWWRFGCNWINDRKPLS